MMLVHRRLVVLIAAAVIASESAASNRYEPVGTLTSFCGQLDNLEGLEDVVVSPDDAHVYAAAGTDGTISVFERDGATGTLTLAIQYLPTDLGVSALGYPTRLAISPDGNTLYALSRLTDTVAAFARNATDGSLTFVEVETDGVAGVDGLDNPIDLVVSPDGLHVYVAANFDQAVAIFARDSGTGALSFVGTADDGGGTSSGLAAIRRLAITPDGLHLYVSGTRIVPFARTPATGALTFIGTTSGVTYYHVVVSPDGAHAYASQPNFTNQIDVFSRNVATGALTLIDSESTSTRPGILALDATGTHLYASGTENVADVQSLEIFARDSGTGALMPVASVPQASNGVDGLDGVSEVVLSASGTQLYTAASGDAGVGTFDRSLATGMLTQTGLAFDSGPPLAAAPSPGGEQVYVACARSIVTLARDALTGALTPVASQKHASIAGADLIFENNLDVPRLVVAPDGGHVYFERGGIEFETSKAIIEVLARDGMTGLLTSTQVLDADGSTVPYTPSAIVVGPDDEHVYVSNAHPAQSVYVYDRNPATGLLAFIEYQTTLGLAGEALVISPDGADVYLLGHDTPTPSETLVRAFARDAGSGMLTQTHLVDQMPNFDLRAAIAVSGDGENAYVGVDSEAAISSHARDQASGDLGVVAIIKDGVGGTTGLANLRRLAVAADGAHVLAVSDPPGALSVFRRHDDDGALSFVESHVDGALGGARDVFVSPDSQFVYVLARDDEGITIFRRTQACAATPVASCQGATKAKLKIKTPGTDARRLLTWKWQDAAVPVVGDPLTTSDLAVCLYDASGGTQPLIDVVAPAGGACGQAGCWVAVGAGVKYGDKDRTPDGVQRIRISPKPGATSKVVAKVRGANVPSFSLPLAGPVTVQLQASTGECLEATFTTSLINDSAQFVATLP